MRVHYECSVRVYPTALLIGIQLTLAADLVLTGCTEIPNSTTHTGLAVYPLMFTGSANYGNDAPFVQVLTDSNARAAFISYMVKEATTNKYDGYVLDPELGGSVGSSYSAQVVSFLNQFKAALGTKRLILTFIASNVKNSWCGLGAMDLPALGLSSVDLLVPQDYTCLLYTSPSPRD